MKCSGESTGCSRCIKQSLVCHYSTQKQMGRPPKKRMREDDDVGFDGIQSNDEWTDLGNGQFSPFGLGDNAITAPDTFGLCPQVYFAPFRMPHAFPDLLSMNNSYNHSGLTQNAGALEPLPSTASPWPDFSSVSAATASPFAGSSGSTDMQISSSSESSPVTPPQCSCLSYLYLCLSHLSSLAPFPISHHILCSLFIGAKTARDVIRCKECPKTWATVMQNVMFTGTLLNVVADAWLRVSKTDPVELGKQAAPPAYVTSVTQASPNPAECWKKWLRQTVRNAVIGGPLDPAGRVRCSDSPDLLSLITEFEGRQRRWHSGENLICRPQVSQSSSSSSPESHESPESDPERSCDEKDYLCLRVIGSVREVISKFNFEPHEYPLGAAP